MEAMHWIGNGVTPPTPHCGVATVEQVLGPLTPSYVAANRNQAWKSLPCCLVHSKRAALDQSCSVGGKSTLPVLVGPGVIRESALKSDMRAWWAVSQEAVVASGGGRMGRGGRRKNFVSYRARISDTISGEAVCVVAEGVLDNPELFVEIVANALAEGALDAGAIAAGAIAAGVKENRELGAGV